MGDVTEGSGLKREFGDFGGPPFQNLYPDLSPEDVDRMKELFGSVRLTEENAKGVDGHGAELALNEHLVDPELWGAINHAWGARELCWPGCYHNLPEDMSESPSDGACFVTSLAVWAEDRLQGENRIELVPAFVHIPGREKGESGVMHYYLKVDGQMVDLTKQQMPKGTIYEEVTPDHPKYQEFQVTCMFADQSIEPRVDRLLKRMRENHGYVPDTPEPLTGAKVRELLEEEYGHLKQGVKKIHYYGHNNDPEHPHFEPGETVVVEDTQPEPDLPS